MAKDIFDEMLKEFSSIAELKDFTKEQHKTIMNLTSQISQLKKENELLKQGNSVVQNSEKPLISQPPFYEDYQENICRMELKKLHDVSMERALTLEETKKVEIYTKLLIQIDARPKTLQVDAKAEKTDDLLKLISNNE